MSTPDILKRILGVKREEVAAAQAIKPLSAVRAEAEAEDANWAEADYPEGLRLE